MPACSNCKKAGSVCYISSSHPDCARCVRLGSRCNVSFDEVEGKQSFSYFSGVFIELLLLATQTLTSLNGKKERREKLQRELAELELSIQNDEASVREAVAREIEILNAWDASDFGHTFLNVAVGADMVADFGGNDERAWNEWVRALAPIGSSGSSGVAVGSSSNL